MGIQYKPTKQKKEKPIKAPKAPKADKPMKLGSVGTVKTAKASKPPKPEKAPKMAKTMKFESQKPMQIGKVQDSAKSGGGALRQPVKPGVIVAVFAVLTVALIGIFISMFIGGNSNGVQGAAGTGTKDISIISLPTKTSFFVGENPSFAGLQLKVTMKNGKTYTIDQTECKITGFDTTTAGTVTVTVTYDGVSTSYDIVVKELPDSTVGPGTFNGLSFKSLPKTEFKVGDWPSVEGGVLLRHYSDGSTKEIEMKVDYIYGFNTSAPGKYTVTVKYVENGFLAECTYEINVTE